MTAPSLSTERLRLRNLDKATSLQVGWLRDAEVVRFSEQRHREHSLKTQLEFIRSFAGRSCVWAVHLVSTGEHIGNLTARVDEPNGVADVGVMIGEKKFWGKGLGREAYGAACDWLIRADGGGLRKLEAGCMKTNVAMHRIIERARFRLEGERLNHFVVGGDVVTMLLYGRFR